MIILNIKKKKQIFHPWFSECGVWVEFPCAVFNEEVVLSNRNCVRTTTRPSKVPDRACLEVPQGCWPTFLMPVRSTRAGVVSTNRCWSVVMVWSETLHQAMRGWEWEGSYNKCVEGFRCLQYRNHKQNLVPSSRKPIERRGYSTK